MRVIAKGDHWDNPDSFEPERFLGIENESQFAKEKGFIPFGIGPRSCIGQKFAMNEALIMTAMIFKKFSLSLSSPDQKLKVKTLITQNPEEVPLVVSFR